MSASLRLLASLRAQVGAAQVVTDAAGLDPLLTDWRRSYRGRALAAVFPATSAEVAAVVRACVHERVPMVPQGGNTGLVGGATPDDSGRAVIIGTRRLKALREIDPVGNTITAEAGVVLADLQQAAQAAHRLFPLSLASEGSCTLGGNLATNAGGTAVLRYGNARELCLAIEVVTADGAIVGGRAGRLPGLRKDNTGYDLRDLFIGAEGTLGIITAATMRLYPLPLAYATVLVAVPDPRAALALLQLAQQQTGPALTSFELISGYAAGLVERHFPAQRVPFAQRPAWSVLIELSDHESSLHAQSLIERLIGLAIERNLVTDSALASSEAQRETLWALRENISEAQAAEGANIKHDIALPIARLAEFLDATEVALHQTYPWVQLVTFGHLGDGNLHYNVSAGQGETSEKLMAERTGINRLVHDAVHRFDGSISAEHGLGQLKREEIRRYKSTAELAMMKSIKAALDPHNLMNPGKLL